MKKRFLTIILALALCMGLAVPALAADGDNTRHIGLQFRYPHYDPAYQVAERTYQVRRSEMSSPTEITYGTPSEWSAYTLPVPLGMDVTLTGLRDQESVGFQIWMDSDGDGVYEDRPLAVSKKDASASIAPFAESYSVTEEVEYERMILAERLGFDVTHSEDGALTLSNESLYETFGANTVLSLFIVDVQQNAGNEVISFLLTGETMSEPTVAFTDVSSGSWYLDPVAWAVENEITNGTTETTFSPDTDCTQAQILTFLWRAAGKTEIAGKEFPFEVDDAYRGAVLWADDMGMIDRSTFDPGKPCTRSTAMGYIWAALGRDEAESKSAFTDVPAGADYAAAVAWAVENGITNGTSDTTFSPDEVCSRGQIVTFLYRAYTPGARLK